MGDDGLRLSSGPRSSCRTLRGWPAWSDTAWSDTAAHCAAGSGWTPHRRPPHGVR